MSNIEGVSIKEFSLVRLLFEPRLDILHLHWPDVFVATARPGRAKVKLALLKAIIGFAKLRGLRVVWTAHNLKRVGQRNGPLMTRAFWPAFIAALDGVIYLTESSKLIASRDEPALARIASAVIPHGPYEPPPGARLGDAPTTSPILIFFGSIVPYKNAAALVKAFGELKPGTANLWILGKMSVNNPDLDLEPALERLPADARAHVTYDNRFLSEDELASSVRAATLVVLPYREVLNSGSVIYSLSARTPVLASRLPLFDELAEVVGEDWLTTYEASLTGEILRRALDHAEHLKRSPANPNLEPFAWPTIARQTAVFFSSLLKR